MLQILSIKFLYLSFSRVSLRMLISVAILELTEDLTGIVVCCSLLPLIKLKMLEVALSSRASTLSVTGSELDTDGTKSYGFALKRRNSTLYKHNDQKVCHAGESRITDKMNLGRCEDAKMQ